MSATNMGTEHDDEFTASRQLHVREQRHQLLADNAKDVIWSMSPTGQITYVSPAVEKLRGLTPEQATSQSLDQILTPSSQTKVLDYFSSLHEAQKVGVAFPMFRGDLEYYRSDGTTFWTEVFALPLTDEAGQLSEILGVTRDIQERKEYEESLKLAREQAEQANAAKSKFLAHISHEIRTPMTTLLSWIQLARAGTALPDQRELLDKAQNAGRLLLGIINDLLDLSRMEKSALDLQAQPFDVRDALGQVTDLTIPMCQQRGIEYSLEVDPNVPKVLVGDASRLVQALLNLTSNAAKFTEQGQIEVDVRCLSLSAQSAQLRFSVKDTGIGIEPQWHDQLFDDLFQVPELGSRFATGTGLGLAISKRLVQLMEGTIGFESTPGQGSTFWFTSQFAIPALADRAIPALQRDLTEQAHAALIGKKILLVEDYPSLRKAVVRLLRPLGIRVDEASHGQAALEMLQHTHYDLILMDLFMPVMDGMECARQIRADDRYDDIAIVGLSAAGFAEDRERVLAIGMNDYLMKPFMFDDLVKTILKNLCAVIP
jgi:PAS domain S-box-containing protein